MGFGDEEKGEGGEEGATTVACSICLDIVTSDGDRSTARLQCGHQFHLDCIGSAFNAKGVMQCPNCRKVETGNWLYASSPCPLLEPSMDDWVHDEDLYELSYSEMPFGVHWCPFSRLTQAPSFEEGESSPPIAFHDLLGHHAIFTDHPATSSAAHPCPYVSYLQPLQASSSSSSHVSSESPIDGPGYHHHWSHIPRLTDVQTAHALPPIDLQYHSWEHHSQSYSPPNSHIGGPEQASASSATRAARLDIDGPPRAGSLVHPFLLGHGSGSRARATSSFVPSLVPPYLRAGLAVHDHQNSQNIHGTIFAGIQRSGGSRGGLGTLGPTPHSLPDHTGFYLLPSSGPSGRSLIDAENSARSHFYASWEREQFVPYQLFPVERESAWWVSYSQSAGASDSSHRVGMWRSERSSSQVWSENSSYLPAHVARVQSFMRGPNS